MRILWIKIGEVVARLFRFERKDELLPIPRGSPRCDLCLLARHNVIFDIIFYHLNIGDWFERKGRRNCR